MAFPIPSHLPRRPNPHDVSSEILSKIDQATNHTLTTSLASSWITELEDTIGATKAQIKDRIHRDLPEFERQLESSKSVQTRLQSLASNVDRLDHTLSDSETGLIPKLIRTLTAHATLAQQSVDATYRHQTVAFLLRARGEFGSLLSLVQLGKLPQAIGACGEFERLLQAAPAHSNEMAVMADLKRRFHAAKSRTEEQLSEAYIRSVSSAPKCLKIQSSVLVRQSETRITLPEILLTSAETGSLSGHLTTLKRDVMAHYVDFVARQPSNVEVSSDAMESRLTIFPAPLEPDNLGTRLENLSTVLTFLSSHLMAFLPPSDRAAFSRSLCKPIVTSVLSNVLIPFLPSSFDKLPPFLEIARQAVAFEGDFVVKLLGGDDQHGREIKAWVDGLGGHYERQRRVQILDAARLIVLAPNDPADRFVVEIEMPQERMADVIPVQAAEADLREANLRVPDEAVDDAWGWGDDEEGAPPPELSNGTSEHTADDSWGLDDTENGPEAVADADDGWGFDDQQEESAEQEEPKTNGHSEPDPADSWGLEEDAGDPWDDPWDDPPPVAKPQVLVAIPEDPIVPSPSPRMATRLQKLANKGKHHLNDSSPLASPGVSTPMSTGSTRFATPSPPPNALPPADKSMGKRPPALATAVVVPKETFTVSGRMRQILAVVRDILSEGQQFAVSKILSAPEGSSVPGTVIHQCAPTVLDLFRALYPVKCAGALKSSAAAMQFSNDCLYLSDELLRLEAGPAKDRLDECRHRLKVLGDSWFQETVDLCRQSTLDILSTGADGFTSTSDQDRYDECETAINQVVRDIKTVSQRWKPVLNKSKYYSAVGILVDTALSRVLEDILELPDITEVESQRLSELCRMLNVLEALFVEDTNQQPFAWAYVPCWLKFSYLSELLEASMADISDLFDSGSLVDFDIDELVRLVRALFADTPLRTNTINKITAK
ncbi:unnamed protein product [Mycena citricolor]|uniref:ZW10 C-terminal helical domain-containing protein n=1 Tax=Mycena citricolor TaxID=2018698 RepID=A0AAD2H203_9AGAR|nr:unnamed protein product [Mycena citricolor]